MQKNLNLRRIRPILEMILPKKFLRWLAFQYGNFVPPKISFSAYGEDLIVYQHLHFLERGFYLDIGCFHPKWGSNTYLFHKKGWRGVAIDIDDYKLDYFKRARGGQVSVIKAAVCGKTCPEKKITAYKFRSKMGWSDLNTIDEKTALNYKHRGMGSFVCEDINAIGINDILKNLPPVNFLSIDIEGTDLDIIEHLDYIRYPIQFILFEALYNFSASHGWLSPALAFARK